MAKTKISEFSATPGNNTDIDGINIAEGCAPSGINDAIRELMSQLKDFQTGAAGDSFNGPVGTTTAAAGAFTTLSASSTVTLSGGTANGVPYLNGSKVLTTGSALTFDGTVFVSPNLQFGSSSNYLYQSATTTVTFRVGTSPSYFAFKDVSGLPLFDGPGGQLGFGVGGSEQMRLTSTGLGIGTSSPGTYGRLEVRGAGYTATSVQSSDASGVIAAFAANSSSEARLNVISNHPLAIYTNNTERARIDSSGNVLVTNPAGLGYGAGSGGTVTQATSKSTTVTLNKPTGQITMNNAALGAGTSVAFTFNNSILGANDTMVLHVQAGVTGAANYIVGVTNMASGSCVVFLTNRSGGSLSEAVVINFAIIKGATS